MRHLLFVGPTWKLTPDLATGISFKTQALYLTVFLTRYIDLVTAPWRSLYNVIMKIFFIASSGYTLFLMRFKFKCVRPTSTPDDEDAC